MKDKLQGYSLAIILWIACERILTKRFYTIEDIYVPGALLILGLIAAFGTWKGKTWAYALALVFALLQLLAFILDIYFYENAFPFKEKSVETVLIAVLAMASLRLLADKLFSASDGESPSKLSERSVDTRSARNDHVKLKNRLTLALAVTGLLCFLAAALWLTERHKHIQSVRSLHKYIGSHDLAMQDSWQIMVSYGLVGRRVQVTVGDGRYVEFIGAWEWENTAQLMYPVFVAALPAQENSELVTVTIDQRVVFQKMLDHADSLYLTISGSKDGEFLVEQGSNML